MQAVSFFPKFTFQDNKAAQSVNNGPKIMSGRPTGLNKLAMTQPKANPATAGKPIKNGSGVSASLILI